MILADTNIWLVHFRQPDAKLTELVSNRQLHVHPMVLGEIAVGPIIGRDDVLTMLDELPRCETASHEEVMQFIESVPLHSRKLSYIDVHLLAATMLTAGCRLWTRDRRLLAAAGLLKLGADLP